VNASFSCFFDSQSWLIAEWTHCSGWECIYPIPPSQWAFSGAPTTEDIAAIVLSEALPIPLPRSHAKAIVGFAPHVIAVNAITLARGDSNARSRAGQEGDFELR
jgi:hypothetical protein